VNQRLIQETSRSACSVPNTSGGRIVTLPSGPEVLISTRLSRFRCSAGMLCPFTGTRPGVAALKDPGAQQIQASASQDPFFMARRAVQIGVSILNGQKPASTVELLPSKLVTRDNIAEYKGWTSDRSQ